MVTHPHQQAIKKGNMEGAKIYAAVRVEWPHLFPTMRCSLPMFLRCPVAERHP